MTASHSLAYAIFQAAIIALILLWSCWFAWRRLLPRSYRAVQAKLAASLTGSANASLRSIGQRFTPQQVASGGGCGSGGGCSSCGTCATTPVQKSSTDAQPLVFHPPVKR